MDRNDVKTPLVTVLTVVFNGEKVLEGTIQSVLSQSYHPLEYIVLDGGSRDGTVDVIKKYEKHLTCWASEPDRGIYDGMNKAVAMAKGEWLLFMNAGDWFHGPDAIARVFESPVESVDLVYGDCLVRYDRFSIYDKALDPSRLFDRMICSHQSIFSRRRLHQDFPFDLSYRICADFHFLCRAMKNGKRFLRVEVPVSSIEAGGFSDQRIFANYLEKARAVVEVTGKSSYYLRYGWKIFQLLIKRVVKRLMPQSLVATFLKRKYARFQKPQAIPTRPPEKKNN